MGKAIDIDINLLYSFCMGDVGAIFHLEDKMDDVRYSTDISVNFEVGQTKPVDVHVTACVFRLSIEGATQQVFGERLPVFRTYFFKVNGDCKIT